MKSHGFVIEKVETCQTLAKSTQMTDQVTVQWTDTRPFVQSRKARQGVWGSKPGMDNQAAPAKG